VRCWRCRVCRRGLLGVVKGQLIVGRITIQSCIVDSHPVPSEMVFALCLALIASGKKVMRRRVAKDNTWEIGSSTRRGPVWSRRWRNENREMDQVFKAKGDMMNISLRLGDSMNPESTVPRRWWRLLLK